jgi:hypothetical protein
MPAVRGKPDLKVVAKGGPRNPRVRILSLKRRIPDGDEVKFEDVYEE